MNQGYILHFYFIEEKVDADGELSFIAVFMGCLSQKKLNIGM
jgi:hypothetical protein